MKISRVVILAILFTISGCEQMVDKDPRVNDQCKRAVIFQACLQAVPSGPTVTHDNPWDQVVRSCEEAAYYQSLRLQSQVSPVCRDR